MHQTLILCADAGRSAAAPTLPVSYLRQPEARTLRRIAFGLALSLCLHVLFLVLVPKHTVTPELPIHGTQGPLNVRLNPPAAASPPVAAEQAPVQPVPRAPVRPRPPPPMMTVPGPAPQSTPPVPQPAPIEPPDAAPTDFMSMVNAKRERRAAAEAAARADRLAGGQEPSADDMALANINRNARTLTQREGTSGVFQILSKGHRAAQFSFRGWTNDSRNSRRDLIDVDAGLNGNIEQAIIRRMIELIRTHYTGNFNWDSHRLGRVVVLSARVEDTAGLEEFMMREFFQ